VRCTAKSRAKRLAFSTSTTPTPWASQSESKAANPGRSATGSEPIARPLPAGSSTLAQSPRTGCAAPAISRDSIRRTVHVSVP
jgi:hypothetical protein